MACRPAAEHRRRIGRIAPGRGAAPGTPRGCSTGDYPPYGHLRVDERYAGIDVELAQSLAASLGVRRAWGTMRWPAQMPTCWRRLRRGHRRIPVSLRRQPQACFSAVLEVDGKVPLVHCAEQQRCRRAAQMTVRRCGDRTGDTDEAFARRELPLAWLILFPDDTRIFRELDDGHADAMITDAAQARSQQRHLPPLCAVKPHQPLQYSEKALLRSRDDAWHWKAYVDPWLH